jgi:hypothetical protein
VRTTHYDIICSLYVQQSELTYKNYMFDAEYWLSSWAAKISRDVDVEAKGSIGPSQYWVLTFLHIYSITSESSTCTLATKPQGRFVKLQLFALLFTSVTSVSCLSQFASTNTLQIHTSLSKGSKAQRRCKQKSNTITREIMRQFIYYRGLCVT